MNRQWLFVRLPNPMRSRPEQHAVRVVTTMVGELVDHLRTQDPDAQWEFRRPDATGGPDLGLWFHSAEPVLKELERRLLARSSAHNWPMITCTYAPETVKYHSPGTLRTAHRLATESSSFALELLLDGGGDPAQRQWLALAHLWQITALVPERERAAFLFHLWQFGTDGLDPAERARLAAEADAPAGVPDGVCVPGDVALWDRYLSAVRAVAAAGREDVIPVNFLLYDHVLLTHERLGIPARTGARAARTVRSALAADTPLPTAFTGLTPLQSA
ncbi:lantibiotic dehydratase C-terminal domain-containing protein [Streptomyces sp. NRRL B-3229]|uniref:lantibiotic dehydratase C-terminal domain-containing protein n=1 Tax=Streptomyces sp. NRRL B-3229 TaxID=1463836 RepID=UPI00068DFD4E|nr:lantibiotic dehydratase C-terminal domain-containing protein [Streptomyces sp. NRRL B-3229]